MLLNRVLSPNIPNLRIRRARYGVICNQEGGIIDDAIVYRLGAERYLLVPNASNAETVADWIEQWRRESDRVEIEIATSGLAMIALQGPAAQLTPVRTYRSRPHLPQALPRGRGRDRRCALTDRPYWIHRRRRIRADGARRRRGQDMGGARRGRSRPHAGWAPGTFCVSRPGCRFTATTSMPTPTPSRLGLTGSSTWNATSTWRGMHCSASVRRDLRADWSASTW